MPQRIQRKRTKGWKMPQGAKYVGRPTVWGNPFVVGERYFIRTISHDCPSGGAERAITAYLRCGEPGLRWVESQEFGVVADASMAVGLFRRWHTYHGYDDLAADHLRGQDLACWCPLDQPCHADVLLEIAND